MQNDGTEQNDGTMRTLDETGKACPAPVIDTKRALEAAAAGTAVQVLVDNTIAVENLAKFAARKGYGFTEGHREPGRFHVVLTKPKGETATPGPAPSTAPQAGIAAQRRLVVVSSQTMGNGDEKLGATLLKGFIYALTEQEQRPDAIVFYNGGAHLTVEGSESLSDLRRLADDGVEILTCGTCLDHYQLTDQLAVGGVTNMYTIAEMTMGADVVFKP